MSQPATGDGSAKDSTRPRAAQYLAVPLGGLAPAHHERSGLLRMWRRHAAGALTVAGCAAGAAAVLVSAAPRTLSAFSDPSSLHIGGVTLHRDAWSPAQGYVAFSGDAAVLLAGTGAAARSAGAATLGGLVATGWCAPSGSASGRLTERCAFRLGGARMTSVDVFDEHTQSWSRTYSDGVSVVMQVPAGGTPVPIPLPLGR